MNSIKNLKKLIRHIEENYAGDYASVGQDLTSAIYFLHFLEKEMIDRLELQDLCHALHELSQCFYHAHSERRLQQHNNKSP